MTTDARAELILVLQSAYSGELAAAYAYHGHSNSVSDAAERERIQLIEQEELHHRALVGEILLSLEAAANPGRERRAAAIGRTLSALCHVTGWVAPMYGAGKLESRNIREYENAARHARDCGRHDVIDCLLTMAEVEWEHEFFFRSRILAHRIWRRLPLWPAPPPKEDIRSSFDVELQRVVASS
jgi:rubrerythrin